MRSCKAAVIFPEACVFPAAEKNERRGGGSGSPLNRQNARGCRGLFHLYFFSRALRQVHIRLIIILSTKSYTHFPHSFPQPISPEISTIFEDYPEYSRTADRNSAVWRNAGFINITTFSAYTAPCAAVQAFDGRIFFCRKLFC